MKTAITYAGAAITALGILLAGKLGFTYFLMGKAAADTESSMGSDPSAIFSLMMVQMRVEYALWFILAAILFGTGMIMLAIAASIRAMEAVHTELT